MTEKQKQWLAWIIVVVVLTAVSLGLGVSYPLPSPPLALEERVTAIEFMLGQGDVAAEGVARPVQFRNLRLLDSAIVEGDISVGDDLTVADDVTISGDTAVTGDTAITGDLAVTGAETVAGDFTAGTAITLTSGKLYMVGAADDDATSYDYMAYIGYAMTGTSTKDRNYGLLIEGTRPAGQEVSSGDFDEAGIKVRIDTEAVTTTAGTVLRGIDIEAKADNPDGTVTNLFGAALTAKSDTSAGSVANMIALQTNSQANAEVTDSMMSADLRLYRQSANEPTAEYVLQVRNSSTAGTGADAAIYVTSDYGSSATTDSIDYGLDLDTAAINTAELRGSNGETIANTTDTAWIIGGFICAEEGAVIDLSNGGTITPVATYQPITNDSGGSITTSATTAIADGPVAGAILIIVNEDAQNIVIKDGANTILSGDITLTGGANDTLTLIWNGADWVGVSVIDN